jgi:hypothetical protein
MVTGARQVTIIINVGKWGGIYCTAGRLCLGWIAFTFLPFDIDPVLEVWSKRGKRDAR